MAGFSEAEPSGDESRDIAILRWKAIEAFNAAPRLTPLARRVGVLLVCKMDNKTRCCFPGETRLAAELGCDGTSITRAKKQLKDLGLISWELPSGRRQGCLYTFDLQKLATLANAVKAAGDKAVSEAIQTRTSAGMEQRQTRTSAGMETQHRASKPAFETFQTRIQDVPNPHLRRSKPAPVRGYITQDITQDIPHDHAPLARGGAVVATLDDLKAYFPAESPEASLLDDLVEHDLKRLQEILVERGLEGTAASLTRTATSGSDQVRSKPPVFFPKLTEEFGSVPEVMALISAMHHSQQGDVARVLATNGREQALALLLAPGTHTPLEGRAAEGVRPLGSSNAHLVKNDKTF
jgi:hypothetical protein